MGINLIYIFSAVIVFGLINFIFIFILKGKVQDVETRLQQENKSELAALTKLISENQSKLASSIDSMSLITTQHFDAAEKGSDVKISSLIDALAREGKNNSAENKEATKSIISILSEHNEVTSAKSEAKLLTQIIDAQEHHKTMAFSSKQEQLANLAQLSSLVQTLRIENIVEITNELSKHNELKVETPDFIKHLGDCKVLKIEDAHSGQVTQVFYENGVKRSTDTFAGENLKYQMFYDETGKAQRGIELDTDGKTIFEYTYDDAGEISKRIEFNYDKAGQKSNQIEKSY